MALKDLRNTIATINSTSDFNTAIATYPDLAAKLQAVETAEGYPQKFTYNGIEFSTEASIFNANITLHIDSDNKIMLLKYNYYNTYSIKLFCCYADDKDYVIFFGSTINMANGVIGTNAFDTLSMSAVTTPTLSSNTFNGYYPYTEDTIFKEIVRYITTPSDLQGVEIKSDTKDMLIVCGGSHAGYNGCMCVQVDL